MAHQEVQEENLSHDEIQYRYYIQRGLDFTKIELFGRQENIINKR